MKKIIYYDKKLHIIEKKLKNIEKSYIKLKSFMQETIVEF